MRKSGRVGVRLRGESWNGRTQVVRMGDGRGKPPDRLRGDTLLLAIRPWWLNVAEWTIPAGRKVGKDERLRGERCR